MAVIDFWDKLVFGCETYELFNVNLENDKRTGR